MEDAEGRRAACRAALHCQLTRPRAGDREIVVYEEFAAGERDRLAFERGIELNRVSIAGRSDRTAQRVGVAVGVAVAVGVGVGVGVAVDVAVGVGVSVAAGVAVGVTVGVAVAVGV